MQYDEFVQKGIAQALTMNGSQRVELGEGRVDPSQSAEELSAEAHRVIVTRHDVDPRKSQLRVSVDPLCQKD